MGAGWWQQSLADTQSPMSRRQAINLALGAGAAVVGVGALVAILGQSEPDAELERRTSLDMQRMYGWSFGAAQESVTFDGISTRPFDRSAPCVVQLEWRTGNGDGLDEFGTVVERVHQSCNT